MRNVASKHDLGNLKEIIFMRIKALKLYFVIQIHYIELHYQKKKQIY